jgi:hypothetical protein
MLAAYGFFYNGVKPSLDAAAQIGDAAADPMVWRQQLHTLERARKTALLLGIVALLIWLLFLREVISELEKAWDADFSLRHYSTLDVAFVVFATAWLALAIWMGTQVRSLSASLRELRQAKPREI